MKNQAQNRVSPFIATAVILLAMGWSGLAAVIQLTQPNGGTRWLFFFTLTLAVTGTILPLVVFLNRRLATKHAPTAIIIIRQALWFGIYVATLAWLQIGRVLTPTLALLLAVGLIIIEWLLRLRERSQWKP